MRALRIVVPALLCIGLAVGVASCGGQSRRPPVSARTLSIYTSLPFQGPYANDAQAIFDGEQLALSQAGNAVNGYTVRLEKLDDASSTGQVDPPTITVNARIAASDPTTVAYIGELAPGSSLYSIPLLSDAGILQVSPGDTAPASTGATFARVVPPDSKEALAQLVLMQEKGVRRLFIVEDRSTYGADIAAEALREARAYGIEIVDPRVRVLGPDPASLVRAIARAKVGGLLYAGGPGADVAPFWNAVSSSSPAIKKFASADITNDASWAQTTAAARDGTYLSAPGIPKAQLPHAGTQFVSDFVSKYGSHVSWASGIFGYVAMSGVLEALYGLGNKADNQREKVTTAFMATRALPSALGSYDILGGQTTFDNYCSTPGQAQSAMFGAPPPCAS